MKVFIVFCHPSHDSFTKSMCDAFIRGITDSGNEYILSDLYRMGFDPVMKEQEYLRDAYYQNAPQVADDVLAEQAKINAADAIAFIYPVFWTDAPAMLKGRRYGNMIIAGSDLPFAGHPSLPRTLLGGGVPAHLWDDAKVRAFAAGTHPLTDAQAT